MTAFIQEHGHLKRQPHIYESCPTHHHHQSLGPAGTSACLSKSAPIASQDTVPTPNPLASLLASRRNPSPSLSETSLLISQHPSSLHTSSDQPIPSLVSRRPRITRLKVGRSPNQPTPSTACKLHAYTAAYQVSTPPPPLTADHGSSGDACTAAAARLAQREVSQYGTHLPLLCWA